MAAEITSTDIQRMIETNNENLLKVIAELRKPTVLEQKVLDEEAQKLKDRQVERVETAAQELRDIELRKQFREICTHKRRNNTSRAVYVPNGDFFICQECRLVCFKEPAPPKGQRNPEAVYSNKLYNEFQQTARLTDI